MADLRSDGRTVGRTVGRSVGRTVGRSVGRSDGRSVGRSVGPPVAYVPKGRLTCSYALSVMVGLQSPTPLKRVLLAL